MSKECWVCHEKMHGNIKGTECKYCRAQLKYWQNLTPEERRREDEDIARYVAETEGRE